MAYDPAATRARLLTAGYEEFLRVGLAGARVARIAEAAKVNKQAAYHHFGSKEALFEAVMADRLRILADAAPFTPADLPGYAGALFDALAADPGVQRLNQWKMLENPEASAGEVEAHVSKAAAVAEHYGVGMSQATDVMMIVLGIVMNWNATEAKIRNPHAEEDAQRLREHRTAVVSAVTAVTNALLGEH
ncbi:TetR family transcriptional regulator [Streptomyces chartreusis]